MKFKKRTKRQDWAFVRYRLKGWLTMMRDNAMYYATNEFITPVERRRLVEIEDLCDRCLKTYSASQEVSKRRLEKCKT